MTPLDNLLMPAWENAAFLIGLVFSLLILSFVIRDSWLVRAAQYLLVGVTLAYTVVLVWSNLLWPRLFQPLLTNGFPGGQDPIQLDSALWIGWLPLLGGLLLWAAGIDYLWGRARKQEGSWLRHLAAVPLALLMGVGLGAGIAGALQGTFLPQFSRATAVGQLLNEAPPLLLVGLLTLVITGGVLLHLRLGASTGDTTRFPALLRPFLVGWAWLGERALWLAAGVIFARLFASRITLLIARLDAIFFNQQISDFWRWLTGFSGG